MDYILQTTCGSGCPCRKIAYSTHLNLVIKQLRGVDVSDEVHSVRWINVRSRDEHECIINDAAWCEELGLDQIYEINVYLKRWGRWLNR
jgi:hypothetical protein